MNSILVYLKSPREKQQHIENVAFKPFLRVPKTALPEKQTKTLCKNITAPQCDQQSGPCNLGGGGSEEGREEGS